jgi:SAM-dependent methyltransferase
MTAALPVAEKIRTDIALNGNASRKRSTCCDHRTGCASKPKRSRTISVMATVFSMSGVGPQASAVDVVDLRQVQIPFQRFNGTSIPFPDKSFDHVVLSEVLHHSHEPMALVKECRRVARRSIILFEDMPDGRLGKLILYLHVRIFARRYDIHSRRRASATVAARWRGCRTTLPASPESRRSPSGSPYTRASCMCAT